VSKVPGRLDNLKNTHHRKMTWTKVVGFFPMVTLDLTFPMTFKFISRSSPFFQMEFHTFDAGNEKNGKFCDNMSLISDKNIIDQ